MILGSWRATVRTISKFSTSYNFRRHVVSGYSSKVAQCISSKVEITSHRGGKPWAIFDSLFERRYFPCYRKHLFTRSRQLRKLETVAAAVATAATIFEVGNHNYV